MRARELRRADPAFPEGLTDIEPEVSSVWVLGQDPNALGPKVAIIGARSASSYGLEVARAFAGDLAAAGLCIVSGMARGIDSAAHEGALRAGGRTLAVLGSGVNVCYPATSDRLYRRIIEAGCVVSEYPLGTGARKHHFPARNRVIAAISLAVIVVQSRGEKSGTMITAGAASGIGRDVFAVPGDVRSELSRGTHKLIHEGSKICTSPGDVLEGLAPILNLPPRTERPIPPGLPDGERALLVCLNDGPGLCEQLAAAVGMNPIAAVRALTRLELAGLVVQGPGGMFRRT